MFSEEEKIIQLINNFTANDYGEFLLNNATKDFLFIRPSGNPIDALGFIEMKTSNPWCYCRSVLLGANQTFPIQLICTHR
mgnify:CR=1 FL=1